MKTGNPFENVAMVVTVQPPATASSALDMSAPKMRPRPKGNSQIALATTRLRTSNDVGPLSAARLLAIWLLVAPPSSQPS